MKKLVYTLAFASLLWSCKPSANKSSQIDEVQISVDLNDVKDDKVMVIVTPPSIKTDKVTYHIPKIIPGTYSEDDYGKFIENVKAYDAKGNTLTVAKADDNSWTISNAKALAKLTYYVNDTYDIEDKHDVFSPAGTNILAGENFMLNTHAFFGYFSDKSEVPYKLTITHPASLWGATSLNDADPSNEKDVFTTKRYAELVDNPIMYSKPNYTTFKVDDMDILISVYSPNNKYTAEDITADMKKMITAQKKFLGPINSTKKYSVLLYLSDTSKPDAKGFGALEHNTSTTVVMPEMMPKEALIEQMVDVVSHEFFHIVTPLSVHSKEIQYFNYNTPNMSEHLWMYEGITEYFANLFQVNQGLIDDDAFYKRIAEKITTAKQFGDMSFTYMSKNILKKPYKDSYYNVYQKGTLIAMCLDIQLRELSGGKKGILDLMQKLSHEYGNNKPFNDEELFKKITELTYPEIGTFLNTYVAGATPIPYEKYFEKVGVSFGTVETTGNPFIKDNQPFITVDPNTKEIIVLPSNPLNDFFVSLGIKGNDIIQSINDTNYNLDNIDDMVMMSMTSMKTGDPITVKIKRNGKVQTLKGTVKLPVFESEGLKATDDSKKALRDAWLRG